jgi:acetyl-CoA C-acetyltransferase
MLGLDHNGHAASAIWTDTSSLRAVRQSVVKNKGNARKNPYAQEAMDLTVDQVLKSTMLADPITQLQKKPVSDGACAMILASEEVARKLTPNPVWITGSGNYYEAHNPGDRDLSDCEALVKQPIKPYKMAAPAIRPRYRPC